MAEWTKESLRKKLFELLSEGERINPQSVSEIEGFYSSAKKLHGSYEAFLIENGLDPKAYFHRKRHLNTIKSTAGLLFEEVLADLLVELGLKVIQETKNGFRPDFIVKAPSSEKWVDAKLTEMTALQSSSINKYVDHCDKLVLIYLIGEDKDYNITKKVRVVNVNRFLERLTDEESKKVYIKRFKLITKIAEAADKEIKDFADIDDYAEVI
ncbi:hypothetical protein [Cytobacillus kochii]|uniref:hypothetical protein n=1 Tax=Cytobacillus kochii TaxID=859143 RepID=UPI00248087A6|nr:hypothetical protein [Cytobacillus kochii]